MVFINLTPHKINNTLTGAAHPASGTVARVSSSREEVAPGFFVTTYGEVTDLPEAQEGVLLIVSGMVREQVPARGDVVSPGALVRDREGRPLGCEGFSVNEGFLELIS
jgi:hypothetical protein